MKRFVISITSRGRCEKVKLFDAIDADNGLLPHVLVDIAYYRDASKKVIEYANFIEQLSVDTVMVQYVKYESDGLVKLSINRTKDTGAKIGYLLGSIFPLDRAFFIIADFPHSNRPITATIVFEFL